MAWARVGTSGQVAPATTGAQQAAQLGNGEHPALVRGWGHGQHGQRVPAAKVSAEGDQGARVVLPKAAAQLVELALPGPDQALVGPGQHLDRDQSGAVAGDRSVQVPVGSDQVGQDPRVAWIGLGT